MALKQGNRRHSTNLLSLFSHEQTCKCKEGWLETETRECINILSGVYKVAKVFKCKHFSQLFHYRKMVTQFNLQGTNLDNLRLG